MQKILYYTVYGLLYAFSLLPLRLLYLFGDGIYFLIYHVVHYRRRVVWKNLTESFPEKKEQELRRIEKGFYHWFCDYLVESIKLFSISEEEIKRRMVFKETELVDECVSSGQSCAIYLGHYCNWEWVTSLPFWISPKAQCGQIYHPLENACMDKMFLAIRQRFNASRRSSDTSPTRSRSGSISTIGATSSTMTRPYCRVQSVSHVSWTKPFSIWK